MNQILYVETKKNKKKKIKKNKPVDIKKVTKFFAISIIIIGIIITGQQLYSIFTNMNNNKELKPQEEKIKPSVNIERKEDDIEIQVQHIKAISSIIYKWNEEEEKIIEGNNRSSINEIISLPFGTNTLNIKVVDVEGTQTEYQKEYIVDGDGKPIIDLSLTKENTIKISARDVKSLKYIEYTWNNSKKTKIEANKENLQLIEKEVEIPIGQNTLKVEAVNTNDVITTKELQIKGVKNPNITLTKEEGYVVIKVEDEVELDRLEYTLNGQKYRINLKDKNYTSVQYKLKLEQGENILEVKAVNKDGGTKEQKGRANN
ncbi:MAG: hypothetical protein HFJ53_08150 [Clostridia bacterium]|nr:hypothetical protein [Clostridia bacterium]